ncbi:sensor domain-containing diguanylate cyclase [Piscinibacter gummiphilus]|uniref:diguanylate cyclase n=1 Tax=Piscinibacter gummiphilus TaxID=946333 RepID=A0A1W6LB47_9BURK|nr:sensor domain-containing diguanylate cyclase [Piscinibacter gummiphilus]ARN21462.1 hypothetical protein A4W93_17015 [Piscinibacter gummiphilus]ATU66142.1 GGDEF domain-containing protein [Piscinibacter gummiphilus]
MPLSFRSRSLRSQLALVFGVLVVAVAVTLALSLAALLKQRIEREEGHQLRTLAGNVAQVLADNLFHRAREIEVLSGAEDIWAQGLGSGPAGRLLERAKGIQPDNTWIGVTDTDGVIQSATGGLMVGRNAKERPWFAPGLKGLHVGDVHSAKMLASMLPPTDNGEPLRFVDFSAPVRVGGQTVGVLVAHGTWRWAHSVIEKLAPANAAERHLESFIFDRDGKMIYAPGRTLDTHLAAGQGLPAVPATLPKGVHAVVLPWQDGADYLTAVAKVQPRSRISDLGWTVVTREPTELAFAEAHRAAAQALMIGVVFALLAAAVAWRLSGRVARPLRDIARAARDVGQGTPGAEIPQVEGSSEVRDLAGALSAMTRRLLEANSELEQRVAERTSELEHANLELNRLARHDPLTGLLNRRGFNERLKATLSSALRRNAPVSLIVVDADHFKRVNDTHGHEAGDLTLTMIANALKQRLRESDVVARLGGEEFVALLPDTAGDRARGVAEDLVEAVAAMTVPTVGRITISCGVSAVEVGADDGTDALRRADEGLYRAKASGRNRAVWQDEQAA